MISRPTLAQQPRSLGQLRGNRRQLGRQRALPLKFAAPSRKTPISPDALAARRLL